MATVEQHQKRGCPRHLYDLSNDPYNHPGGTRDSRPCSCGTCPPTEKQLGGHIDLPSELLPSHVNEQIRLMSDGR